MYPAGAADRRRPRHSVPQNATICYFRTSQPAVSHDPAFGCRNIRGTSGKTTCLVRLRVAIVNLVSEAVMQVFRETGAYLKGHFRLTSGLHSNEYLQCALVLQHPAYAERFGRELASRLPACDMVVSPAVGGLIIGHEVARAKATAEKSVRFLFTERDADGKMTLRRGFSVAPGETAIVIEDVVTTGGSTREVIAVLQAAGVNVLGAGSVIDRSGGRVDLGDPRVALATLDVVAYPPEDCPLCKQGLPVVKPGSRPTPQ
jgi:orotate phosphoribosyltransferase